MTINNFPQASHPAHARFGPVLNVGICMVSSWPARR
jgi:hypothetical protein